MKDYEKELQQLELKIDEEKRTLPDLKENTIFYLVNFERHQRALQERPHKRFLDTAMIYECIICQEEGKFITIPIDNDRIQRFSISAEELENWAFYNTKRKLKPFLKPLIQIMNEFITQFQMDCFELDTIPELPVFYLLSNELRFCGANLMVYQDYLEQISKQIQSDFYICPSSIHELIVVPKEKQGIPSGGDLREIVQKVNVDVVEEHERLSNEVYVYCSAKKELTIWTDETL